MKVTKDGQGELFHPDTRPWSTRYVLAGVISHQSKKGFDYLNPLINYKQEIFGAKYEDKKDPDKETNSQTNIGYDENVAWGNIYENNDIGYYEEEYRSLIVEFGVDRL